jgi:two-component system NarL family sensor kinase
MREQQRSSLATVVHDEITQSIVGAIYELEAVAGRLGGQESEAVTKVLATLRDATRRSREVIASLRSPLLGELGLASALKSLCSDFQEETRIRCQVKYSGSPALPEPVQTTLYRIAREALANVRKHSDAGAVRVKLTCSNEQAHLTITDDGRGIGEGTGDPHDHFGILMMQEQAAACGGACIVANGKHGGVMVEVRVPLVALDASAFDEDSEAARGSL